MPGTLQFLEYLSRAENRDYIILVDRGEAAQGLRWLEASKAVTTLLPFVCAADQDGITVYVLGEKVKKLKHVKDANEAQLQLDQVSPGAETILCGPLDDAMKEHFREPTKPSSILVVTPGVIKDKLETAKVIVAASNALKSDYLLSISFVQVGDDPRGTSYLKELTEHLAADCKFNVVDSISVDQMPANLDSFLRASTKLKAFNAATVAKPEPFKKAVRIGQTTTIPEPHAAVNAMIRNRSPAAQAADSHAAINAIIAKGSPAKQVPASHDAINAVIQKTSSQSSSPKAVVPALDPHASVNAVLRNRSPGVQAGDPHAAINAVISKNSPTRQTLDPHAVVNTVIRNRSPGSQVAASHDAVNAVIQKTPSPNLSPKAPVQAQHAAINDLIKKAEVNMPAKISFLDAIKLQQQRDYVVILDCSSSMSAHRWNSAREAVAQLGPHILNLDPDGVNLYLFNDSWKKVGNVTDGIILDDIFMQHVPHGGLKLGPVLNAAFTDHFANTRKKGRSTSILVLVAGHPKDLRQAADYAVQAANSVSSDDELTLSFLQMGDANPYVGQFVMQCNTRARRRIADGHAVGTDANWNEGIPIQNYIDHYYRVWPAYNGRPAFAIKPEKVIIEYHTGTFTFE